MSTLAKTNLALFALLIAHTVDHAVNQPTRDLPAAGSTVAVVGFMIVAVSTALAVMRRPQAPLVAVVAGLLTTLGLIAIHLAPTWHAEISDPYWDFEANAASWALFVAAMFAGLALAGLGARMLGPRTRSSAGT